ncbi:MAG: Predicted ATPase with chaperone activity, associated with Flp pilus assembly [uncultured Gemmatimonadaceae bacterium]|uniref:Predicted ATPase with chaperone activity, associated with Flp pilus assembly n=1 Tax=uncultured Gemmatimonadaceae bacterium TaxID=246130 RepID=A0A6J4MAY2_9BACT|nr:MAG: Predicted ATPase with chaperone activity, associated with Flp pilus assembly [uncultured Gemmatimonadaceae bacterium]
METPVSTASIDLTAGWNGEATSLPSLPAPRTIEETGIRATLLEEIAIKIVARERDLSARALGDALGLGPSVTDELVQRLRKAVLVEVTGHTASGHRLAPTTAGRAQAAALLATNQYAGPVPVPLASYVESVRTQAIANGRVRPQAVREAFGTLVLDDEVVRQVGIGIASGAPLMLFGPSGTGKTSVAERIPLVFGGGVFVPHAIEVGGEIVAVFDPGVHRPVGAPPPQHDRRWVYCERPFVVAGGELTMATLDLEYNATSGYYAAPPQLKANAGVFVIDDFGRQRMRPEELLNRWIVPLDRGVDYLTLHGGAKFAVPFSVLVVFATNLDPSTGLAADAGTTITDTVFLRRIPNKVKVGYASREQFHEIFRRACAAAGLGYDPGLVDRLVGLLGHLNQPLRPSIPRDIVRHVKWEARYEGSKAELNAATIARACRAYFALSPEVLGDTQLTPNAG